MKSEEDNALDALEEVRDELNAPVNTELLALILRKEREFVFELADRQSEAVKGVTALIETYLGNGEPS